MARIYELGNRAVGIILCAGMVMLAGSVADAGNYSKHCYWKTVIVYETVNVKCEHYVTKYDHCGNPYPVKVVSWKTVEVPVKKQIQICH